jgi:hypothetical protein
MPSRDEVNRQNQAMMFRCYQRKSKKGMTISQIQRELLLKIREARETGKPLFDNTKPAIKDPD